MFMVCCPGSFRLSVRHKSSGTVGKLLTPWGSTAVNILGAEERMGEGGGC